MQATRATAGRARGGPSRVAGVAKPRRSAFLAKAARHGPGAQDWQAARRATAGQAGKAGAEVQEEKTETKLPRAQDECLGAGRRRRTWQAAISPGERHTRVDPGISEMG